MAMLDEKIRQEIREDLKSLTDRVKLVVFTQRIECPTCAQNTVLVKETAALSDLIDLEIYNFQIDKEKSEQYRIDKIPAIVVEGKEDYGIRFYGMPTGYEFTSLLEAIKMVSVGDPGLGTKSLERLSQLDRSVHIQVFVTPTCPYCPSAVIMAHKIAMASQRVTADMISAGEFPHLTTKYHVYGVPKTVVNEEIQFEGSRPEADFVEQVMKVVDLPQES